MLTLPGVSPSPKSLAARGVRISRISCTPWAKLSSVRGFYRLVERLAGALGLLGVSADALTYGALVLALGASVSVGLHSPGLAALLVLLSGGFDLLDGAVARATHSVSRWGALLDSTLDRIADAAPLAGIVLFYSDLRWAATFPLLAIASGFVISYVRARAEALGLNLPSLFMRRAERVLLLALSLGLGEVTIRSNVHAPLMLAGVALTSLLGVAGAVAILAAARKALDSTETSPGNTRLD